MSDNADLNKDSVSPPAHRHIILIVEDSVIIRKLLCTILTRSDFDVLEADNGRDALTILETTVPDLILSDLSMPLMGGKEFLISVRSISSLQNVPVLMQSAEVDASLELELKSLGAAGLITKMSSPKALIEAIHEVLKLTPKP